MTRRLPLKEAPAVSRVPLGLPSFNVWSLRAACRGKIDKDPAGDDQWHPYKRENAGYGKRTCNGPNPLEHPELMCPVRGFCLAWALANDERWGTWGGMDQWEREAHRKRLREN